MRIKEYLLPDPIKLCMAAPVATISEAVKSETFSAKVTDTGIFLLAVTDFSVEARDILVSLLEDEYLASKQPTRQSIGKNKITL